MGRACTREDGEGEGEGEGERETNVLGARKFISPPVADGDANRATDGFSAQWRRGGRGGREMRKKRRWFYRFTYLRVGGRAYKPHNSPSGDPYPTNFQIINISVAALLRAS